ncbi:hypothetical protein [Lentzea jiangxiensis]|uniref:Excreted virulence factor EspC, type VII ESX diderm n=1 Tax=Lentzea jiangxiensis TaxID=641025 RepID=A0A1H0FQ42_9PSEU|nr:hypothetical protein [Lentzea jiangxiensis]SDN96798.1 hypothetical protein SAMN05421507_101872 [Lentzea jiangxiensis]
MGTGFHAEPEGLKHTAKHDMGKLVEHTESARLKLADTELLDGKAFAGHEEVYEAHREWLNARSMLLGVFARNKENLELAQEALTEVAERYIAVDADNERTFGGILS